MYYVVKFYLACKYWNMVNKLIDWLIDDCYIAIEMFRQSFQRNSVNEQDIVTHFVYIIYIAYTLCIYIRIRDPTRSLLHDLHVYIIFIVMYKICI